MIQIIALIGFIFIVTNPEKIVSMLPSKVSDAEKKEIIGNLSSIKEGVYGTSKTILEIALRMWMGDKHTDDDWVDDVGNGRESDGKMGDDGRDDSGDGGDDGGDGGDDGGDGGDDGGDGGDDGGDGGDDEVGENERDMCTEGGGNMKWNDKWDENSEWDTHCNWSK